MIPIYFFALLTGLSPLQWRVLDFHLFENHLKFYEQFPFSTGKFGQDTFQVLRSAFRDIKSRQRLHQEPWIAAFGTNGHTDISSPGEFEAQFLYRFYLYRIFGFSKIYCPNLVNFDEKLIKRVEIFGEIAKNCMKGLKYRLMLTMPQIGIGYIWKLDQFKEVFGFRAKIIPNSFQSEQSLSPASAPEFKKVLPLATGDLGLDPSQIHDIKFMKWVQKRRYAAQAASSVYHDLCGSVGALKDLDKATDESGKEGAFFESAKTPFMLKLIEISGYLASTISKDEEIIDKYVYTLLKNEKVEKEQIRPSRFRKYTSFVRSKVV